MGRRDKDRDQDQGSGPLPGNGGVAGPRVVGVIKRKVTDKGFGFIRVEASGQEVFFHHTACKGVTFGDLEEGDMVVFTPGSGPKGPRAENVERSNA